MCLYVRDAALTLTCVLVQLPVHVDKFLLCQMTQNVASDRNIERIVLSVTIDVLPD